MTLASPIGWSQAELSPSLVNSTIKTVQEIADILLQANSTTYEARARLFGPQPATSAEGAQRLREAPNGLAGELSEALARAHSAAIEMRENVAVLTCAL